LTKYFALKQHIYNGKNSTWFLITVLADSSLESPVSVSFSQFARFLDSSVKDSEFVPNGYKIFRQDRDLNFYTQGTYTQTSRGFFLTIRPFFISQFGSLSRFLASSLRSLMSCSLSNLV
jgi:hypothetical protein